MMLSLFKDNNAGYPAGGSLNFVLRVVNKYQELGGTLSAGKRVKKILIEEGKAVGAELDDGTIHKSDYVIAACDLHTVIYDMLDGKYIPEDIKNAFENWPLLKPLVQVSFGIKKEIKEKQMMNNYLVPAKIGATEIDSYIKYTGVYRAAYEGFMPTKSNTNKIISPIIKELDNFILAGQWLFPGGGLPPSALSGKWAIEVFYKKEKS